jgi:hypothetical protein
MSDLLTRLAQRALGTAAPAVQPRLPSRFADTPGDASLLLREEEVEAIAPRAAPSPRPAPAAHPSPAPNPVLRRELDSVGPRDAVRTRETDAVHPPREDAAPRPVAKPTARPVEEPAARPVVPAAGIEQMVERVVDEHHPAPVRSIGSQSAASPAARPVDVDQPRPASAAPPAQSAEHAREAGDGGFHPIHVLVEAEDDELLMPRSTVRARNVTQRGEDGASPPASPTACPRREAESGIVEVAEVAEVAETRAEHRERDADSTGTQPRGSVVRPEAVRVAERPAAKAEEQPERPVVRVTIGRIEVRAAPAPAQPQPAARPGWKPPVLSLDDYLEREARR